METDMPNRRRSLRTEQEHSPLHSLGNPVSDCHLHAYQRGLLHRLGCQDVRSFRSYCRVVRHCHVGLVIRKFHPRSSVGQHIRHPLCGLLQQRPRHPGRSQTRTLTSYLLVHNPGDVDTSKWSDVTRRTGLGVHLHWFHILPDRSCGVLRDSVGYRRHLLPLHSAVHDEGCQKSLQCPAAISRGEVRSVYSPCSNTITSPCELYPIFCHTGTVSRRSCVLYYIHGVLNKCSWITNSYYVYAENAALRSLHERAGNNLKREAMIYYEYELIEKLFCRHFSDKVGILQRGELNYYIV